MQIFFPWQSLSLLQNLLVHIKFPLKLTQDSDPMQWKSCLHSPTPPRCLKLVTPMSGTSGSSDVTRIWLSRTAGTSEEMSGATESTPFVWLARGDPNIWFANWAVCCWPVRVVDDDVDVAGVVEVVGLDVVVGKISTLKSSPFLNLVSEVFPWLIDVINFPLLPNLFSLLLVLIFFFFFDASWSSLIPMTELFWDKTWLEKVGDPFDPCTESCCTFCKKENGWVPNNGRNMILNNPSSCPFIEWLITKMRKPILNIILLC